MNNQPHVVIIEGNISAGKSTLTQSLADCLKMKVFFEPTLTNPYLEKFYNNPKEYALRMQLWLLRQRFQTYVNALRHVLATGQGVLLDRSVFSDWVFAEKNRQDGNIDQAGFEYYMRLRQQLLSTLPMPSVSVYLDVAPATCYERIHGLRGRDCEASIPLAYLQGLHQCYGAFVEQLQRQGTTAVLSVAWDQFGDPAAVARQVRALPPLPVQDMAQSRVRDLLLSPEKTRNLMDLSTPAADGLHARCARWFVQEKENGYFTDFIQDSERENKAMQFNSNDNGNAREDK